MTSLDSQLREKPKTLMPAKPKHKCVYTPYMNGQCLRCRNEGRWKYYLTNPNPIFGKRGTVRTQA